ncbi:PAS domain S-box protein [Rhodoferax mekongensis]|uniref:histidine kinase n=1 Tax=Rhodoferax mekongensis TaxID=3068341 RepID=A0ABZ0AXZ1_9BURK|nr:PAS domain S-box protein [Rhodoferax sp. TBRC 17307]WNO04543.1 PAS domain S-box protein [Rhodoferax sp. TBRC 17307]
MSHPDWLPRVRRHLTAPYSISTIIMGATLAVMVLLTVAYNAYTYHRIANETLRVAQTNATSVARMVAGSSSAALIAERLNALQSNAIDAVQLPGIDRISIYKPDGVNLMEVTRAHDGVHVDTGKSLGNSVVAGGLPTGGLDSDHFVAWQEVDKDNTLNNVWVRVDYSLENRDAELQRLWLQSFWMALILMGVVMLCLHLIIRKALAPVRELTEFAAQIPLRMGDEVHLPKASVEVSLLQAAINQASRGMALQVNRVQAIVNTAAEAIIGLDEFGRVSTTNPAASSMFGRTEDELLGQVIECCVPGLNEQALHEMFGQGMEHILSISRVTRHDFTGTRADGTLFPVEICLGEVKNDKTLRYACIVRDLTDERAAQETSELYERALASSHNAVFITNGKMEHQPIVYINDAFQKFVNLPRWDILGESLALLRGKNADDPGVRELMEAVREHRNANVTIHRELENGDVQIAEVSLSPVMSDKGTLTHFVGIVSDITARVRAEEAMAERRAQLDAIFSLSPDGFVMFDAQDQLVFANPAFERMTGLGKHASTPVSLSQFEQQLLALCDENQALPTMRGDQPDASWEEKLQLARPQRRVVQARSRRNEAGRRETILYFRDVTHEDQVDRMKSEFLTAAAHELRTPMVSIFGFSELLTRRKFTPERQTDMLQTIHRQSGLLVKMLNELLDLARIESRGGLDMQIAAHPLNETVENCIKGLMLKDTDRPVLYDTLPPLQVLMDPEKMQQALTNLLANAFKYSPQGGDVTLSVRTEEDEGVRYAVIDVRDQGIGMTPEQLERAFERFYRADASGNIPGTGLGLSLVKEIADLHKGRATLQSTFGEGTTASLWIPLAEA